MKPVYSGSASPVSRSMGVAVLIGQPIESQ